MGDDNANDFLPYCEVCIGFCEQIPKKCISLSSLNQQYDEITTIKLSTDVYDRDQLAVGLFDGSLVALRLPSDKDVKKDLIERSLNDVHKSSITCVEWSDNGNKIFSGDSSGLVMLTVVDFDQEVFHSSYVCCEDLAIRQMSHRENLLAVCTSKRIVLVDIPKDCEVTELDASDDPSLKEKANWRGIVFAKTESDLSQVSLFSSLSDINLAKIDKNFRLENCIDLSPSLSSAQSLKLPKYIKNCREDERKVGNSSFGTLKLLNERFLVTTSTYHLFVIDLMSGKIIARAKLFSSIIDFCCTNYLTHNDQLEFFVLCGERIILRIGSYPDKTIGNICRTHRVSLDSPCSSLYGDFLFKSGKNLVNAFSVIATKHFSPEHSYNHTLNTNDHHCQKCEYLDDVCSDDGKDNVEEMSKKNAISVKSNIDKDIVVRRKLKVPKTKDSSPAPNTLDNNYESSNHQRLSTPINENFKSRVNPFQVSVNHDICNYEDPNLPSRESLEALLDSELNIVKPSSESQTSPEKPQQTFEVNVAVQFPESSDKLSEIIDVKTRLKETSKETEERSEKLDYVSVLKSRLEMYDLNLQKKRSHSYGGHSTSDETNTTVTKTSLKSSLYNTNSDTILSDQKAEIWCSTKLPSFRDRNIQHVAGCSKYVCAVDSKRNVFYSDFSSLIFDWKPLDVKAEKIAISPDGKLVAIINHSVAYLLMSPLDDGPIGADWIQITSNVCRLTLRKSDIWYLATNGEIFVQQHLDGDITADKLIKRKIDCIYKISQLTSNDECVWALTSNGRVIVRTGLTVEAPLGDDWAEANFCEMALSISLCQNFAWILDANLKLKFCAGICHRTPLGHSEMPYEVILPEQILNTCKKEKKRKYLRVVALPCGLWLCDSTKRIWFRRAFLVGHRWRPVTPQSLNSVAKFKRLCVANLTEGDQTIYETEKLVHISGGQYCLWGCDQTGRVYVRFGYSDNQGDKNRFVPLGYDIASVADDYATTSSSSPSDDFLHPFSTIDERTLLTPAWIPLESRLTNSSSGRKSPKITKIFCNSESSSVWALDENFTILVRIGISNMLATGEKWETIDDMKAIDLCVGNKRVWALDNEHRLFMRHGININKRNITGNYWRRLPGQFNAIELRGY
uniref:Tectonin beta-propeller repeat-containing protein 2 n=1 Tax=Romanomermis culicivorax TaxID=13658 RepID=A0A915JQG0_ROMCU